jgi:uncharacterized protein (DUF433 family)
MESPIKVDPEILGGTPCFAGTRVPIQSFIDHIVSGYNIDYFISDFPSVTREQAEAVMKLLLKDFPQPHTRRAAG